MEVNKIKYKKHIKPFDTSKKPKKITRLWMWIAKFLGFITSRGRIAKMEKINMEGLKPPFLVLSNHQSFSDFKIFAQMIYPYKFHSIATLEGHYGLKGVRAWAMENVGCIPKRRFTTDPHLLSSCQTVLDEYGDVLVIYPEARYTDIGVPSHYSDNYAQLVKKLDKPVVAVVHRGNYLRQPFWNWKKKRKVKTHTTMKKILDVDEIRNMTCEEIIEVIRRELDYDEYKWQRENNILIDEPYRAEGLNKALYQCPHCMTEHQMLSKGDKIWCGACGKTWVLGEFGQLRAITGKTEFSHIPAWYKWQFENVKKEVEAGKYYFEDDVDVYALPNVEKFIKLGKGRLVHSIENGMSVEGVYNKTPYKIHRPSRGLYNIHTEYNYCFLRHEPCIQITIADNNIVCYTHKKDVVTKLYFATLAIHEKLMREREEQKKARPKRKPKSKAESE